LNQYEPKYINKIQCEFTIGSNKLTDHATGSLEVTHAAITCNAPLAQVRGRYGDVHTQGGKPHVRTLSLSTVNNLRRYT